MKFYRRYLDAELRLRGHEPSKKIIKSDSQQSTDDNEAEEDPVYVNIPIKKPTKVWGKDNSIFFTQK